MSLFTFSPGERIRLRNEMFHLRRKLDGNKWQIEKDSNGEYRVMGEKELLDLYFQNLLSFTTQTLENQVVDGVVEDKIAKNFADFPENLQREAKKRLKYISFFEDKTGAYAIAELQKVANDQGDAKPPDKSTVCRWTKKYKGSGNNICSLIPNVSKRGNKKARYPEEVVNIALRVIREIYLNINKNSIDETLSAIRHAIRTENMRHLDCEKLPIPGRKFVRNIITAMDVYELERARNGKNAANKRFREAIVSGEIIMEPLERVEIDHTILDLIVVDAKFKLPLGRPTITIALDRCTRCICGYHVGFDPPSYVSVMKCLSNAIKPKEYVKKKYPDVQNNWPCWGIPDLVVVDNALEFHGKDFEAAALSLLIDIRYCPGGEPWWKGAVERAFRTMGTSLIHTVPGTTFSNIIEKGDYNSLKMAIITEADLNELLNIWICDVYHQTVHRATSRTPNSLSGC